LSFIAFIFCYCVSLGVTVKIKVSEETLQHLKTKGNRNAEAAKRRISHNFLYLFFRQNDLAKSETGSFQESTSISQ